MANTLSTAGKLQRVSLHHTQKLIMRSLFLHKTERVPATQEVGGAEGFSRTSGYLLLCPKILRNTLGPCRSVTRLIFMYPLYNAHQLKETSLTLNPVLIFYILLENLKMSRKKILPRVSGMTVSIV